MNRDTLVSLCRNGVVSVSKWRNRDSAEAQLQLAKAGALLEAGCGFHIRKDMGGGDQNHTVWVQITWPGFASFDYDGADENETFYIPTQQRLDEASGDDWY